jgi:predicted transcriptional regulator
MRDNAGLTADEVNEATGISPNTINPTIRGLVLDGWLEDSGKRRVTRSGNEAIVWVPIP